MMSTKRRRKKTQTRGKQGSREQNLTLALRRLEMFAKTCRSPYAEQWFSTELNNVKCKLDTGVQVWNCEKKWVKAMRITSR